MKTTSNLSLKFQELFGIDLRSLALFRILTALIVIGDLIQRIFDLETFYSDLGILPRSIEITQYMNINHISLHLISGNIFVQGVLFFISLIFAFALLIGFKTRLAAFMTWVLLLSVHNRALILTIGGDELLRMSLFWGMFLPLGACFSIDSKFSSSKETPKSVLSIASVALLAQVLILYWFSIVFKSRSPEWLNGDAIYFAISQEHYATQIGKYLFQFPHAMKLLTHSSFWFETIGPLLLFFPIFTGPIRTLIAFMFIGFQIGMGSCIILTIFTWSASLVMIPFIPSWFWDKFLPIITKVIHLDFISSLFKKISNNLFSFAKLKQNTGSAFFNLSIFGNIFVLLMFLYVIWWNLWTVSKKFEIPKDLTVIANILRIDQKWNLYCPIATYSYWYVIPAILKDGTRVDLFRNGKPVSWKKPKIASKLFKNRHWRAFMLHLAWFPNNQKTLLPYLSWYLCKQWNESHPENKQIKKLTIYLMYKTQLKNNKESKPKYYKLWEYSYS